MGEGAVGWGLAKELASQARKLFQNYPLAIYPLVSPLEERNPGCPGNFAGMSRTPGGVQKVCAKKLRAHFSFPKVGGTSGKSGDFLEARGSLTPSQ